jgi:hypothetical protein
LTRTNPVLRSLSCRNTVNNISSASGNNQSDSVLINQIEVIENQLLICDDSSKEHATYVFQAIKHVLRGNIQSARARINESERIKPCPLSPVDMQIFNTVILHAGPISGVPVRYSTTRELPISSYYVGGTEQRTAAIPAWLGMKWPQLLASDESWRNRFMAFVAEIAQALVNPLPEKYFPEPGSKFIGQYSLENPNAILHRIENIEYYIATEIKNEPLAGTVRSVLKPIWYILANRFDEAKILIDKLSQQSPDSVPDADEPWIDESSQQSEGSEPDARESFNTYMDRLYYLGVVQSVDPSCSGYGFWSYRC